MAEAETKDHANSAASSPDSTAEAIALRAPKDRNCPFCGQAFTSSSLGRHLDLYIKPKNPKPPDGVHDVEEIKKMRGSITRRQARSSTKGGAQKEDLERQENSSGWTKSTQSISMNRESRFGEGSPMNSPVNAKDDGLHTWINQPNWQATGVINNLPARVPSRNNNGTPTGQAQRAQEMRRDAAGNPVQRPDWAASDDMWKLQESAEVGRAAEMALRQVLGSLEAAKKKAEPRKLFEEFDFCALGFPGLCLAILPRPPTLFSSTPFPVAHTWSLSPPGEQQFDTMSRMVNERVAAVRNGTRENVPESLAFRYHVHLQGAWEHWQKMPEHERTAAWNLEVCRAFAREKDTNKQLRGDLEAAQQRIRHLEAEYDRLSRCQLPREYLMYPPNTMPVSSAVMKGMKTTDVNSGAYDANYDADVLINKWKATVKAATRPTRPPPMQSQYSDSTQNTLRRDMMLNGSVFGVNGAMPREQETQRSGAEHTRVTYETPQNPGTVISNEDDGVQDVDVDADAEGEEEPGSFNNYVNQKALARVNVSANQTPYDSPVDGVFNANGKRPLAPGSNGGRGGGPKIYKDQRDGRI